MRLLKKVTLTHLILIGCLINGWLFYSANQSQASLFSLFSTIVFGIYISYLGGYTIMNSVFKSALKEHRKLIQLNPEKPIRKSDVYWHIEEVGALVHRYAKYFLLCLIIFDGIAIFNTGKSILLIVTSSVVSSYEPWDAR